jgi:hypothetical protein
MKDSYLRLNFGNNFLIYMFAVYAHALIYFDHTNLNTHMSSY